MGRKKDEKPIPPMGPGSKVVALTPQLQRHITLVMDSKDPRRPRRSFYVSFNTILAKKVPEELYKNEELQNHARRLEMQNNKYKKLPAGIGWLGEMEYMNLRHNLFKSLPGTICNLTKMEFFDASENQLKKLPTNLHKAEALIEVQATYNKIKSPPGKLGTAPHIEKVKTNINTTHNTVCSLTRCHIGTAIKHPMPARPG